MKSMTGFGRAERAEGGLVVGLQVSSVNRKNLEVVCSLPKELQALERKVQDLVRSRAARGRFQFSIDLRREEAVSGGLPSDEQIDAAIARLKALASRHGTALVIDGSLFVQVARLLESEPPSIAEEAAERLLLAAAEEALQQLLAMREQEGLALKTDLASRRDTLAKLVSQMKELAPSMTQRHREMLLARLEQAGLQLDPSDERVLKEIALFADRCDISEELTRLASHLEQMGQLLDSEEPVGRPLEFLIQEIGREVNTTGSKATALEVSRIALDMKNELERLREQVANVE